jgi:hypothetical protein
MRPPLNKTVPNFSHPSLREIREEPRFTEQLNRLGIDLAYWDEIFQGLQFVLARRPDLFHKLKSSPLRVAVVECYKNLPALHVLFAYDDEHVYLLDVYLSDGTEDED